MDIEGAMDTNNDDASSCTEPAIVDGSLATVSKNNESLDEMFDNCQQNTIDDLSPALAAKEYNCQTEPPGSENYDEIIQATVSDEVQTVQQLQGTVETGQASAVSDHSQMAVEEHSNEERSVPTCTDNFTPSIQSVSDGNNSLDVNEALQTFVPNSTEERDVSSLDFIESMTEDTETSVELEEEKLVNSSSIEQEISSVEMTSASDLHFQTGSNLISSSNDVDIHPRPVPSIVISTDLKGDMPVEISNSGDTNLTSLDDMDVFQTLSQSGDDNKDEMDKFLQTIVENEADNDKNFTTENDAITTEIEIEGVTQNSEGDSACTEIDLAEDEVCMNVDSADDETYAIIDLEDNVSAKGDSLDDEVPQRVNSDDEESSTKVALLNDEEFSNAEKVDKKLTKVDSFNQPCAVDTTNVEADITEENDEDVLENNEFSEVKALIGFDLLESAQTQQDTEAEADVTDCGKVHNSISEVAAPDILEITDEGSTKSDSADVEACEEVISDDARVNTTNVEAIKEENAQYVEADVESEEDDPNVEEDDFTLTKCDDTTEVDKEDVVETDDDQTEDHTAECEPKDRDTTEVNTEHIEAIDEDKTQVDTVHVEAIDEDQTEVNTADGKIRTEDQTEVDTADVEIKNEDQTEVDTADVEIKNEDQTEVDTADGKIRTEDQTEVDTADVEIKNEDQTEVDTADVEITNEDQTEVDTADVEITNEDQTEVDTADVEITNEDQTEVDTADVEVKNEDQTEVDTADAEANHTVEADDGDHAEVVATKEKTSTEAALEQDSGDKLKEHIKARYPELDELAQEYLGESSNSDIGQEDLAKLSSKYLDDVDDVADNDEISKSQDPTIERSSKDDSDSDGRTEDSMKVCKEEETSSENKDSFQQGQSMEEVSPKGMLETTDLPSMNDPSLSTDPLAEAAVPSGSEVQKEIKDDKTTNTEKEMENTEKEARKTIDEAVKASTTQDSEKESEANENMNDEKDKITAEKSPDKPSSAAPLCKHFLAKGTCPLKDNCAFRHVDEKMPPGPPVPVKVSSPIKRKTLEKETNSSKRKYRSNRREDKDKTSPSGGEPAPPGTEDIVLPGRIPSVYSKQAGPNFSSSAEANPESTKPFDSATLLAKRSQIRCKHFLRGYCHFGENCHFKHESEPVIEKTPSFEDERNRYDPRRQKKRSRSRNRYSRSRSRERYRRRRRSRSRNSRSPSGKRHHRRSRSRSYDKYRRNSKSSSKAQNRRRSRSSSSGRYTRRSRSRSSERYRRRSRSPSPVRNQRKSTTQSRTHQKHSRTPDVQEKRSAPRYEESHQRSGQRSQERNRRRSKSSDSYGRQSLSSSPDSYGRRSRSKSVERRYSGEKNKRIRSPSTEKQYSSQNSQSNYGKRTVSGWGSCERVVIIQPKSKTKSAEQVSKRRRSRSRSPSFKSSAASQPQAKSRDNTFWNKLVASVDPIRSGNSTKPYRDGYYDQPGDKTKKVSSDQSRKASATIPFVGESKDSDFLSPEEMFIKKMNEFKRRIEKSDESNEETTIKLGMTSDQLAYSSSGYYHSTESGIYKGDLSKSVQKEQNKTAASYYHEQEVDSRGMMPIKHQPSASSTMSSYQGQATANPPTNNLAHILQQLSSWQNAADKSAAQVQPPVQTPVQFPVHPQIQAPVPVPQQQSGGNQAEKEMLAKALAEAIMKQSSGDHQIQAGALANLAGNIAASSRDQGRLHQPYDYGHKDGRSATGYSSSDHGRSASNYPSEYSASAGPSRASDSYDPYNSRAIFNPSQTTSYAGEDRSGRSYPPFGASSSRADPHYGQPDQYNKPPTPVSNQVSFGYSNSASTSTHGRDGYDVADGNYQGSSQYGNYRQRGEGSMPDRGGPPTTQSHPGQSSNSLFQLQRDYEEPNYDDHAPSNRTSALNSVLVQPTIVNKSQKYRALGSLDVKYGSDINSFIKYMVKTAFIGGKTVRAVVKKYLVPKNCTFLIPPMLNSEVYSDLPPNIKAMDAYLHDCHQWLSKGALPLIEQIQRLGRVNQTLADFCFRGGDALTLLGYACVNMSMKRRLMLKNGLAKEYHVLCRSSNRITDFLFGDHLGQDLSMLQSQNLLYPSKDSETTLSYVTDLTATGAYIAPEVVEMVRLACMNKGHISDLREKYAIPANCQNMIPPKVNLEIVKIASYESLEHDHFLQRIQLHVAEAIVPCLHILEKIHEKKLDTSTTLGYFSDAIILLGNAMFTLSKFRLDLMREASPPHLQPLCVWR